MGRRSCTDLWGFLPGTFSGLVSSHLTRGSGVATWHLVCREAGERLLAAKSASQSSRVARRTWGGWAGPHSQHLTLLSRSHLRTLASFLEDIFQMRWGCEQKELPRRHSQAFLCPRRRQFLLCHGRALSPQSQAKQGLQARSYSPGFTKGTMPGVHPIRLW